MVHIFPPRLSTKVAGLVREDLLRATSTFHGFGSYYLLLTFSSNSFPSLIFFQRGKF